MAADAAVDPANSACLHLEFVHEAVFAVRAQDREGLIMAFASVENVKALFAEYVTARVTFTQRLQKEACGGHAFVVQDPDGNMICFSGPTQID